jgi:biotin transport system substrate-specific component
MSAYLLVGAAGVPVFAHHSSGWGVLRMSSATGGYLVGMLVAAALVGRLADRWLDRSPWSSLSMMLLGNVVIYAFGALWLAHASGLGLDEAFRLGVRPFLAGDALKTVLAALALPAAWRLAGVLRDR